MLRKLPFLKEVSRLQLRKKKNLKLLPHVPSLLSLPRKWTPLKRRIYIFLHLKQLLGFIFSNAGYFVHLTGCTNQKYKEGLVSLPATLLQSSNSFTNDLTPIKAKKGKRNEQKGEPWSIKKKGLF